MNTTYHHITRVHYNNNGFTGLTKIYTYITSILSVESNGQVKCVSHQKCNNYQKLYTSGNESSKPSPENHP